MNKMIIAALGSVLILTACGGGGGGGTGPTINPGEARTQTGLSAPIETPAAQDARAAGILARSDSLVMTAIHGTTSHAAFPTYRLRATCSGTRCRVSSRELGYSGTISLGDFEIADVPTEAIGTRHGITLTLGEGRDLEGFGAWMQHSAFAVQSERSMVEGITFDGSYGLAGGDLTGRGLGAESATWRGLMVGTPATGNGRGDRLVGNARLEYEFFIEGDFVGSHATIPSLYAEFSNIQNLDTRRAHSTRIVRFVGIPISSRGTFEAGLTGNRIQGGFYGPDQAEAAGIFEQSNIVGAFGAKKE